MTPVDICGAFIVATTIVKAVLIMLILVVLCFLIGSLSELHEKVKKKEMETRIADSTRSITQMVNAITVLASIYVAVDVIRMALKYFSGD